MPVVALAPQESRILQGVRIRPRRQFSGRARGERTSARKGVSIEFADYREYADGDDLRHLDWNILARLGHPVVKTYQDEEDLAVHLLVDTSPSMEFGEPTKLLIACRVGLALTYVALCGGDTIYGHALGGRGAPRPATRGRIGVQRVADWLGRLASTEGDSLLEASRRFARSGAQPGVVVFLSDGLDPLVSRAVQVVADRGHEVWFVQVLTEMELDPDLEGDLLLVDSESSLEQEMTANSVAIASYRKALISHNEEIGEACARVGGRYAQVQVGKPLSAFLTGSLRKEGWVE
ncbi:MAG: DUF58 domain-containing protein [Fimbriimonadaceae bacterium]|nr:DUF58 domain-containing protein [Fimbriimonadaceae bacterium]